MKKFNLFKNVMYFTGSVFIFFSGMVVYGVVLNLRQVTLAEAMSSKNITNLNNVQIVFGKNRNKMKTSANDFVTPSGEFQICRIDTNTQFHKFLQINYPNIRDAAEALKDGYITKAEHDLIVNQIKQNNCPPENTTLGANIGIHGTGKYNFIFKNLPFIFNWTNGSISVSNENIDELYHIVKIGTPVRIKN